MRTIEILAEECVFDLVANCDLEHLDPAGEIPVGDWSYFVDRLGRAPTEMEERAFARAWRAALAEAVSSGGSRS